MYLLMTLEVKEKVMTLRTQPTRLQWGIMNGKMSMDLCSTLTVMRHSKTVKLSIFHAAWVPTQPSNA